MNKQKIALVLSMGGARGIAHIGVIETLLEYGYEITSITGSSMGAMVGAMYATDRLEACKEWLCSWDKRKMWQLADLTLSRDGLVKGDRFIRELKRIVPDIPIENLPLPYAALATDIANECEVKFTSGSLFHAIRASISIPWYSALYVPKDVSCRRRPAQPASLAPCHPHSRRSVGSRRRQCPRNRRQTPAYEPLRAAFRIITPDDATDNPFRYRTLYPRPAD